MLRVKTRARPDLTLHADFGAGFHGRVPVSRCTGPRDSRRAVLPRLAGYALLVVAAVALMAGSGDRFRRYHLPIKVHGNGVGGSVVPDESRGLGNWPPVVNRFWRGEDYE